VQAHKTADYLREMGVDVTVSAETEPPLCDFTVVHGFGLLAEHVRTCREHGLPVCLSTIYCSRRYTLGLDQRFGGGLQAARRVRLAAALAVASLRLRHIEKSEAILQGLADQRLAYESADVLLPNSALEAAAIRAELGVTTQMVIVPNGIDPAIFCPTDASPEGRERTVLYVGRFEPHKNQLGLIRALQHRDYQLVLAGPTHPHHLDYLAHCKREARAGVAFIGDTTPFELVPLYAQARVHVLPSWYETTGLVSLEAAALHCNVVSTERGYAREYLGTNAWYCDPSAGRSIARAVDLAMQADHSPALRERIIQRFTWRHAAAATLEAYDRALAVRRRGEVACR
jgi:glycosyltransferase involved in cell wall biosynthesis